MKYFAVSPLIVFLFLSLISCTEKEKPVTRGQSVSEKKVTMTSFKAEGLKIDVYLICEEAVEGELLAKALNASGQEIGRAKQNLNLMKDDAKLVSFSFDSNLESDKVIKYMLDFRRE